MRASISFSVRCALIRKESEHSPGERGPAAAPPPSPSLPSREQLGRTDPRRPRIPSHQLRSSTRGNEQPVQRWSREAGRTELVRPGGRPCRGLRICSTGWRVSTRLVAPTRAALRARRRCRSAAPSESRLASPPGLAPMQSGCKIQDLRVLGTWQDGQRREELRRGVGEEGRGA